MVSVYITSIGNSMVSRGIWDTHIPQAIFQNSPKYHEPRILSTGIYLKCPVETMLANFYLDYKAKKFRRNTDPGLGTFLLLVISFISYSFFHYISEIFPPYFFRS